MYFSSVSSSGPLTVFISKKISYRQTRKSRGLSPANHHTLIGGHFILPGSSKTGQSEQLQLKQDLTASNVRPEMANLFLRAYEHFVWKGSNVLEKDLVIVGGWRGSVMSYLGVSGQI